MLVAVAGLHADNTWRQRTDQLKECVSAELASKHDVSGNVNSVDLKVALGNIYPDNSDFHADLLASGLWPIEPEPGSRGASITSCRCSRRQVDPDIGLQRDHRRASAASTRRSAPLST